MPFTEQDKVTLSNIVEGFTLAIVEVCQTLEHQRSLPLAPTAFIGELNLRAKNLSTDASSNMKRSILTNIANALEGKQLRPYYHSVIIYQMYVKVARREKPRAQTN